MTRPRALVLPILAERPPPDPRPQVRADCAEPSNEDLMISYIQGEREAFERLFRRYAPLVLGLGRRHLGDEDAAKDLLQQTFVRLHGARRDYRPGEPFHPWVMTIAMNLVRDQWRRRKRRPTTTLDHEPEADDPSPLGSSRLEAGERATRLHDALAALPTGQREVVELHWFQEQPFAEVARMVGSTEGAVRGRAHRAYARLKELLRDERI